MICVFAFLWLSLAHTNVESFRCMRDLSLPVEAQEESCGTKTDQKDVGEPLFLTPLIEAGKIEIAQSLSRVKPDIGDMSSYSGFLTTNKRCGNNLFFWFFPAQEACENAPLVLWLQGGPGYSSMFGLFKENGPFNHFPDGLKKRKYPWNVKNHVLYIDQPVGTGFSFTENCCYVEDETGVGEDLYLALIQFLELFPDLQKNKFFLTGESYAGHYIPAIGLKIHKENPSAKFKINLAGMMIGDGWMDPREQINYGDFIYYIGLIDDRERKEFYEMQKTYVQKVDAEDWKGALETESNIDAMFDEYANVSFYNYLPQPPDLSDYQVFLEDPRIRNSLHVGYRKFNEFSEEVYDHLANDTAKSVKHLVEILLDHGYPILFYFGQLDVNCGYPMAINFIRSLDWSGQEKYLNARRTKWYEENDLAGYIKIGDNLGEMLIRDAGHMVPQDQPFWAFQLVNRFTSGGLQALIDASEP